MLFLFNLCIPNVYSITSFSIFCQKYIFSRQKFGVDLNRCTKSLKNERLCYFLLKVREKIFLDVGFLYFTSSLPEWKNISSGSIDLAE